MFDVTTARQIDYTDAHGNDLQVTVFRDRTDESVWYMVPTPRLRINNGQPVFNLTKYTSNGNGIAGSCVFQVELFAPPEAKRAAEQQIPGIKSWGQFIWTSGTASFDYELPVDGQPVARQIIVTPSLFGTNTALFQIELETEEAVNTFVSAFSGEGGVSPFSVLYEMGVLTQLLGAEATIVFRASVAIDYERTYKKKKDTWGKSHNVLVSVKQNLKSSGAGDVKVAKGAGGTAELVQLVRDWAWGTLEKQIADAIEAAQRMATGNENPISVLSDINAAYREDTIVEWSTPVSRFLPRFDPETWGTLYHEVDNRQLVVIFDLAGAPVDSDRRPLFEDVEVTVNYPTRTTDNTFKLSLAEGGQDSYTYVAPGRGRFDPNYQYRYKVNFGDGPSYTSDWINSDTTRVAFRPNMFGIRNVTFVASGIPFEGDSKAKVNRVFIDFFEEPPAGQEAKLQTKEMTAGGESVAFRSTYHVPVTNSYTYRLRYQLASGDVVTIQPGEVFGSDNADQIFVLTPQEHLTSFDLRALTTKDGDGFLEINANAAYYDEQNSSEAPPPDHNWDGWIPDRDPGLSTSPTWTFKAQPDPQTAYFTLNGQVIYGDGDVFPMVDLMVPYNRRALVIKDTEQLYGVTVFDDQVDWKQVAQVTINVYQLRDADDRLLTEPPGDRSAPASLDAVRRAMENRSTGTGGVTNFMNYSILPPAQDAPGKSLPLRYTLNKPRASSKILFYFNAEYVMSDGSVRSIGQTKIENKLQIHLPPEPTEDRGVIHAYVVDVSGA